MPISDPHIIGATLLLLSLGLIIYYSRRSHAARVEARNSKSRMIRMETENLRLLTEKEWLIREVHHRVKNNLQLVNSLLNMQTGFLIEASALDAFGDISARIRAISIIHQRLYHEENYMAMINMKDYIPELVAALESEADITPGVIDFRLDIGYIQLNVSQSVSVGLIITEAITNSIKYAFAQTTVTTAEEHATATTPATSPATARTAHTSHTAAAHTAAPPTILISMQQQDNSHIRLIISDNGIGLPKGYNPENNALMGHQLIRTLSDQLEGDLHWKNQVGLSITLQFTQQQSSGDSGYWQKSTPIPHPQQPFS